MTIDLAVTQAHPEGEQPPVEEWSAIADTFGGRVHVEWDAAEPVTPLGQLPFFVEYLKQGGLFDGWVADCPLSFTSPNAPRKRDVLGTLLLSVLAGHQRYAHITALRCDPVNPPLLGMRKVVSEDAVRRALAKIDETAGMDWLQTHLDYCVSPLLQEPWVLDVDTTIKPLYGAQEGAVVGYNPRKPGRPSHCYHTYMMSTLRLVLSVDVQPGDRHNVKHASDGLWSRRCQVGAGVRVWQAGVMKKAPDPYRGFRYPAQIINGAVWLYHCFSMSLRDVELQLAARGVVVSYESIRQWCLRFGQEFAKRLRRRRPRPGDKWHMDEVFVRIQGQLHYLWRAVDQD